MIKHSRVVIGKSYHSSSHFSIMQEMPPNDIGGKFLAHSFPSDNLLVLNNNFNDLKVIILNLAELRIEWFDGETCVGLKEDLELENSIFFK